MPDAPTAARSDRMCPICRDPDAYPLWAGAEPPAACVVDKSWHAGGSVTINSVTECSLQMGRAWQAAEFRKLVPDAFDEAGAMKPGQLYRVLEAFAAAHPKKELVL